jgi:pteridine reductase
MNSQPSDRLRGRTVLITGGARRLGAHVARAVHAAGANLVIHCHHSRTEAERLAAELELVRAASTAVLSADLLDVAQLPPLVRASCERFGTLDVLINNASTFYPTPLGSIEPKQWDDLMGTNLRAPTFLAQAAAPALRRARGLLLNMVDIHGIRPLREHTVYSTAKAGLIMLTRSLARELAPEVRVNAIAPGPVLWPEAGIDQDRKEKILEQTPMQHAGSPDDIARAVLFFASDAPFITGQVLAVDGGRSIGW